jgi:hypothetical protein
METGWLVIKRVSHSSKTHPTLDRKPGESNWVDKAGDLPEYIAAVAKHIHYDSGLSISHAIAAAVQKCKKDAAKGNARAIKSLAQWEAMKARSGGKAKKSVKLAKPAGKAKVAGFRTVGGVRSAVAGQHTQQRHRGTSQVGSNRKPFDESKVVRGFGGKFGEKFGEAQVNSARRIVEAAILNLQIGRSVNLPAGIGWVQRTEGGYVIQGEAGVRVVVRTASEAVQAAAMVLAKRVSAGKSGR